jgi:hypothetical protein
LSVRTNAFDPDEIKVDVEIVHDNGTRYILPAFFAQPFLRERHGQDWFYPSGKAGWKARFAPLQEGPHTARALIHDSQGTSILPPIEFVCVPSTSRGYVRTSARDPRFLEFTDGTPFFAIGQNLAFIGNQQYVNVSKAEEIFARLTSNGANYLRIWTCCEDWGIAIEARKSAFGRSWNWHPPFASMPEQQASEIKCVKLTSERPNVRVDPSHRVALQPGTQYRFQAQWLSDGQVDLQVSVHGQKTESKGTGSQWKDLALEFETSADDFWLGNVELTLSGSGSAYVRNISLREAGAGAELLWEAEGNRPVRNHYNQLDCFMLDELVMAAQSKGIYLQLCMLTRDLYMSALKNPGRGGQSSARQDPGRAGQSPARRTDHSDDTEYTRAIRDAQKFFRYAIARWGFATSVAAWEYWNELDPGLPTDRFYTEMGEFFERTDIYRHLRTTSTWKPSSKDCRHPKLDLADTHFYLRPVDRPRLKNEVEAIIDRTAWLRENAPQRPAHLSEFGLADDKWGITSDMKNSPSLADAHNALWASALSGASGTALFWWWERLDQRDVYPLYQQVSRFVREIPWNSGELQTLKAKPENEALFVQGLATETSAWLWLFNPDAAWAPGDRKSPAQTKPTSLQLPTFTSRQLQRSLVRYGDRHRDKRRTRPRAGNGLNPRQPCFPWRRGLPH